MNFFGRLFGGSKARAEEKEQENVQKLQEELEWEKEEGEPEKSFRLIRLIRPVRKEKKIKSSWRGLLYIGTAFLSIFIVIAGTVFFKNIQFNKDFKETFYQIGSSKVETPFRVIHLSDLHDSAFGAENEALAKRIEELQPDLVIMSGDMIEKEEDKEGTVENALSLCRKLTRFVPVYYIYGNNETMYSFGIHMELEEIDKYLGCSEGNRDVELFRQKQDQMLLEKLEAAGVNVHWNEIDSIEVKGDPTDIFSVFQQKQDQTLLEKLEVAGVHVLWNEIESIEVRGNPVDIFGVLTSNVSAFWQYSEEQYNQFNEVNPEHFKLMTVHEPYIFEVLKQRKWADLVLCGHTHGGGIRVPEVGGLYERKNGWFPERKSNTYISGKYEISGSPLIVSNGIGNESYLRINNQPELVIIDVEHF